MSKGHMEALQALKARKSIIWGKPKVIVGTTQPLPRSVTHCPSCGHPVSKALSPADKQKAYRDRKKAKA